MSSLNRYSLWRSTDTDSLPAAAVPLPFAGRMGANQEFAVDNDNCSQVEMLRRMPDAAPLVRLRDLISLDQFLLPELWKAAVLEAIGSCLLTYITLYAAVGLGQMVNDFSSGPLVPSLIGALISLVILPLLIFSTGPVSGGHLNPTITLATFFGRLATLPRCILYVTFQTFGGAVAGWLLRASLDTRSFTVPGCNFNPSQVSLGSALAVEFTTDFTLIFLSFGVGLDPRQRKVFGPAVSPILVGFCLGICVLATAFTKPDYTGFSGNPARCFGAMVGSHFTSYHWVHWIGPLLASIAHGVLYFVAPPYSRPKPIASNN